MMVVPWLQGVLDQTGWSATELARRSGLTPSTVLRILNDASHRFDVAARTLKKISDASGIELPEGLVEGAYVANRITSAQSEIESAAANFLEIEDCSFLPESLRVKERGVQSNRVQVPSQFSRDRTLIAFRNPDASLAPWFPVGLLMFGTRQRDPIPGDILLLKKSDGAVVRLLLKTTATGFLVGQTMPPSEGDLIGFSDIESFSIVVATMKE